MVVGAGVAGLEAARVAKERGHHVVLFERNEKVGGQVNIAAKAPQRDQMAGIIRWFDLEIKRLGVDLRTHTEATQEMILAENPQIIVIATGGYNYINENLHWGSDQGLVIDAWDILSGKVDVKQNVLVFDGVGGHAGAGTADFIASKGSLVEIATPDPMVSDDVGGTTFPIFYRSLCAKGVIFSPNLMLEKVYKENDQLIAVLHNEYTMINEEREVDQVVIENGRMPNETLYFALKEKSRNQGIVNIDELFSHQAQSELLKDDTNGYLLYRIGEAVCSRNIHGCIYDALRLAKDF